MGNGCVGHTCSPGTSVFVGTGRSSIGQIGSPGHAIEHVEKSGLARHRDHGIGLAVLPDRGQLRRRRVVVVPEIVMHVLEVPQALARSARRARAGSCAKRLAPCRSAP